LQTSATLTLDDVAKRAADRLRQAAALNAEVYSDLVLLLADRARLIARVAELESKISDLNRGAANVEGHAEVRLLSVKSVRQMLDVGDTLVWQLISDGQLEKVKIGRLTRVPLSSVETFLARKKLSL